MNNYYPFVNEPLPYAYDALEPYINKETMMVHHDRLLQKYIDQLNAVLESQPYLQKFSLEELLLLIYLFPERLQTPIQNNAGGVFNHRAFFSTLGKIDRKEPEGMLKNEIDKVFGSYETFKDKFTKAAMGVFGSGYAWLVTDEVGVLQIITTKNQDTPLGVQACPILTIDVWEHAYYLQYLNLRKDYIDAWFQVINWPVVEKNFEMCRNNMDKKRII